MTAYRLSFDDGRPEPTNIQRSRRRTWRQLFLNSLTPLSLVLMTILLLAIVLAPYMVINVPSGHVGVLWLRFRGGTVLDTRQLKEEGLRFVAPWNKVFLYDLRLRSQTETYTAISKDGVNLTAGINIRFRLKHDAIPQLHQSVGPNFVQTLVVPEIGNRMREVIADYTAEEVYSTNRQEIQEKIRSRAEAMLGGRMIDRQETEDYAPYRISLEAMLTVVDTLILGIELPPSIVTAIHRKLEQYYIAQEYAFRIEREVKESQRKRIEAEGIREFQQTVSEGVSDSYLRWRGIEATLQLAQAPNSKVVVIGSGKDGLPIILGNADGSSTQSERRAATDRPPRASYTFPAAPGQNRPDSRLTEPDNRNLSPAAPSWLPAAMVPIGSSREPTR